MMLSLVTSICSPHIHYSRDQMQAVPALSQTLMLPCIGLAGDVRLATIRSVKITLWVQLCCLHTLVWPDLALPGGL